MAGPLADVIAPRLDVLFVGINPGLVSARAGHHFANPANPFWRLLHESGFTSRRLRPEEGPRLLEERLGVTNLVARETAGVSDLRRDDLEGGRRVLQRKIRRYKPRAVVFVGLTAFAAFTSGTGRRGRVSCGEQPEVLERTRVFVVPNPSGRNAHFTYAEMLAAFRDVARALGRTGSG